jgi:hypothetical protein
MTWLYEWQSIVAGLLAVFGGVLAYRGAITSGRRQVLAIREQIEDTRAARQQHDQRRLSVVEWAIWVEGRRLEKAVSARKGRALPTEPQLVSARRKEQLVIDSSPLVRGEREDLSLLDDETRVRLQRVADALYRYNACIQTARSGTGEQSWIDQETLEAIDELAARVQSLQALADGPGSTEWKKLLSNAEPFAPEPTPTKRQRFKVWRRRPA